MKKNLVPFISILGLLFSVSHSALAAPVNINQANADEIAAALKGIGQKKAEAIVEFRNQVGQFENIEQLSQVKGIGEKMISTIRNDILLHP